MWIVTISWPGDPERGTEIYGPFPTKEARDQWAKDCEDAASLGWALLQGATYVLTSVAEPFDPNSLWERDAGGSDEGLCPFCAMTNGPGHVCPPEVDGFDDDPDYEAWCEEMARQCGRSITIGTEDGSSCELDNGHSGPHRGRNPFDEGYVEWTGGGMCAGDPLPVKDMRFTS